MGGERGEGGEREGRLGSWVGVRPVVCACADPLKALSVMVV